MNNKVYHAKIGKREEISLEKKFNDRINTGCK